MLNRQTLFEILLLAALVTALTFAAAWVYPTWDDGRLMLAIREFGSDAIWTNFSNRPLIALFYVFLLKHNLFLPVGIVLHWIGWLSMGLVTMQFWRLVFPANANLSLLPAILSVAPILCKMQTILLVMPTIDVIPPVLAFVALFMLLSRPRSGWRLILTDILALALIVVTILISEYAVVAAAIAATFVIANALYGEPTRRREYKVVAALIAGCIFVSYAGFLWLTKGSGRETFRPSYIPQWLSLRMPLSLASGIWRGIIGGVLESLGSVTLHSKMALVSFICGVVFAALVVLVLRHTARSEAIVQRDKVSLATLLIAAVVALVPVVLMNRALESRWESRFWLPALPVLSCLSVYLLLYVVRTRLYVLVLIVCGFLAGYWTTWDVARVLRNPDADRGLEEALNRELDLPKPNSVKTIAGEPN